MTGFKRLFVLAAATILAASPILAASAEAQDRGGRGERGGDRGGDRGGNRGGGDGGQRGNQGGNRYNPPQARDDNRNGGGGQDRGPGPGGGRPDNRGDNNRGGDWRGNDGRGDNNRGNDWNRGNDRGSDWNRGRDNSRNDRNWNDNRGRRDVDVHLNFNVGRPTYFNYGWNRPNYRPYYGPIYGYSAPPIVFSFGHPGDWYRLRPYDCEVEYVYDYWRGYPAELSQEVCANRYGELYVVQGSQRLIRYR